VKGKDGNAGCFLLFRQEIISHAAIIPSQNSSTPASKEQQSLR
jgi:hypothetical protein